MDAKNTAIYDVRVTAVWIPQLQTLALVPKKKEFSKSQSKKLANWLRVREFVSPDGELTDLLGTAGLIAITDNRAEKLFTELPEV